MKHLRHNFGEKQQTIAERIWKIALQRGSQMLKMALSRLKPPFDPVWLESHTDYLAYISQLEKNGTEQKRRKKEHVLAEQGGNRFTLRAHCYPCGGKRSFEVDYIYGLKPGLPNWRERVSCPNCGLNNRLRATVHVLEKVLGADRGKSRIYLTEQQTSLYQWMNTRYQHVVGSEYLGTSFGLGEISPDRIRNESLLRLTFPSDAFDFVLSFDVLEHIPNYQVAARECLRCIKPGGSLLLTVPFRLAEQETLVRARVMESGKIEHLEEPEYHGDPVKQAGCLSFYNFGWRLVEELCALGFERAGGYFYYSYDYGYLGSNTLLLVAQKKR